MIQTNYHYAPRELESSINLERSNKHGSRKPFKNILLVIIILVIWIGLFFVGYHYSINYFDASQQALITEIQTVKQVNSESIENLNIELKLLHEEIQFVNDDLLLIVEQFGFIQEELELTGETILGSDQTRQALTARIADLDRQLTELRIQLVNLEEAARVY